MQIETITLGQAEIRPADEWQIVCRQVADCPRIICRPNFSLTKSNSFDLHISSS
jgi:hypothetical protein